MLTCHSPTISLSLGFIHASLFSSCQVPKYHPYTKNIPFHRCHISIIITFHHHHHHLPQNFPQMTTTSRRTVNITVRDFHNFFQGWLVRQENYRDQLRSVLRNSTTVSDQDLRDLIARVLGHYQQYYEEKSRIANHDVSLVFSPMWFSRFEQSFFWIAGFKPGLAFRIVSTSVQDMSEEQLERMDRLRAETREEEKRLEDELARIQESVAAPPIVGITRKGRDPLIDGEFDELELAVESLRGEMEVVVANADMLRTRTAERVVEILTPVQNVKFLTAVTELQLKIRFLGWQKDGESGR